MQEADHINDVIDTLHALIDKSIKDESRVGYFICLYGKVTMAVRDAIDAKMFHDNERMHKLDVIFANYFLKNVTHHNSVWYSFFQARHIKSYVVTQHLLLGMNAHINYDLAQALLDTKEAFTKEFHEDYLKINEILYQEVDAIQKKLYKTSLLLRLIDIIGLRFDEAYVDFSMIKARDEAWENALLLSKMDETQKKTHLENMQKRTLKFAIMIIKPPFLYKIFLFFNKICEKSSIRFNLLALRP